MDAEAAPAEGEPCAEELRAIYRKAKNPDEPCGSSGFFVNPGNDLVSHAVARAVPSAQRGLTSVFGMGTGVTLSVRSPEKF